MTWLTRLRTVWATRFLIVPTVVSLPAALSTSSPTLLRSGL
jgi:hypothetical protein